MRKLLLVVALSVAISAGAIAISTGGAADETVQNARQPAPLRGVPLPRDSGLDLIVADHPPFVLDVDKGFAAPVSGIPALRRGVLWVAGVAGRAAVVVARSAPDARIYSVRRRGSQVNALGTGRAVTPAADGRSVWIKSRIDRTRCSLRRVRLDGLKLRAPKPFPCASTIESGGSIGLAVNRTRLVDPFTGRTVIRTRWGVLAAVGDRLLLAGPGKRFTLLDVADGSERRLPWPSILTEVDHQPAVNPKGRLIALAFGDPSWQETGNQVLDVWLLDTRSGELTQLPGMPAFVSLKFTSIAWTDDGRLVFLGERRGRDFVAQWRPGQRRLAVKTVRLPERSSGSDSFAPLE